MFFFYKKKDSQFKIILPVVCPSFGSAVQNPGLDLDERSTFLSTRTFTEPEFMQLGTRHDRVGMSRNCNKMHGGSSVHTAVLSRTVEATSRLGSLYFEILYFIRPDVFVTLADTSN